MAVLGYVRQCYVTPLTIMDYSRIDTALFSLPENPGRQAPVLTVEGKWQELWHREQGRLQVEAGEHPTPHSRVLCHPLN